MIAVIADDITGAAEMAGIAHRLGLSVNMSTSPKDIPSCDVSVIATDTRSMTGAEAAEESARVASSLTGMSTVKHIFKKTDSALRGNVVAELTPLLRLTRYREALYIPANPSKGRIIRNGTYYIGEKPIHETDFSFDPEFPAFSSVLTERFPDALESNVHFADAVSEEDIRREVDNAGDDTLLVGAADLFTAFLMKHCRCRGTSSSPKVDIDLSDALIVCGSTQSRAIDCGAETFFMPTDLYDGISGPDGWISEISGHYAANRSIILAIRDRHRTGKESATYLRETMAETVDRFIGIRAPRELIIEGGATAYAILRRLGWDTLTITDEIAPGVIRMNTPAGIHITMKPGSYPWGGLFPSK